jgi:hypothetical protein
MNFRAFLVLGFLTPLWADTPSPATDNQSNTKAGTNDNPTYHATATGSETPSTNHAGVPVTVPSGKRHRTHVKHGTAAQSKDANRTISAQEVTPPK